jgi:hypothetical protein
MRRILSGQEACARCGLQNKPDATFCSSCGASVVQTNPAAVLATAASIVQATQQSSVPRATRTIAPLGTAATPPAAGTLTGVVVHVDAPQLMRPSFRLRPFLIKLGVLAAVAAIFGTVAIVVIVTGAVLSLLMSLVFGRSVRGGGQGFFKSILIQVTGFFLTSRLLSPKQLVPVTHVRIRDGAGVEHQVRIEGYIQSGSLNVGDDVSIEGRNRGGTIDMRRGWNNRIRSEIRIRRQ